MNNQADCLFTPRERLRWQRARDARLADAIFGCVVRDDVLAARELAARPKILSAAPEAATAAR